MTLKKIYRLYSYKMLDKLNSSLYNNYLRVTIKPVLEEIIRCFDKKRKEIKQNESKYSYNVNHYYSERKPKKIKASFRYSSKLTVGTPVKMELHILKYFIPL